MHKARHCSPLSTTGAPIAERASAPIFSKPPRGRTWKSSIASKPRGPALTGAVKAPLSAEPEARPAVCRSWSKQASHLDDEGAVSEGGRLRAGLGVVVVRVHNEQ